MAAHRLGTFYEGFASWRRALSRAAPEAQLVVLNNAVVDVADYVRNGLDRIVAIDELADMAVSIGFDDADKVQAIIANTFANVERSLNGGEQHSEQHSEDASGRLNDWSDLDNVVQLDRLDDPPAQSQHSAKRSRRSNGGEPRRDKVAALWVDDFLQQLQPPDYLIEGLLQRRCIYSMTGKTGTGKTAIALYIAICVALGRPIDNMEVAQGNVLYFAGENPDDIGYRLVALKQQLDIEHMRLPIKIYPGRFTLSEVLPELHEQARSLDGVALVIVDTSAAYFEGDEVNSNTQQGDHARMLRGLTKLAGGPCVLVPTHPSKNASADNLVPLGAGAFLNEMDGNLTITLEGVAIELHWQGKIRGPDFAPVNFELVRDVTHERLKTAAGKPFRTAIARPLSDAGREAMDQAARGDALLLLAEVKRDGRASRAEYATRLGWLFKSGKPARSRVQKALDKLRAAKLVTVELGFFSLTAKGKKHLEVGGTV